MLPVRAGSGGGVRSAAALLARRRRRVPLHAPPPACVRPSWPPLRPAPPSPPPTGAAVRAAARQQPGRHQDHDRRHEPLAGCGAHAGARRHMRPGVQRLPACLLLVARTLTGRAGAGAAQLLAPGCGGGAADCSGSAACGQLACMRPRQAWPRLWLTLGAHGEGDSPLCAHQWQRRGRHARAVPATTSNNKAQHTTFAITPD